MARAVKILKPDYVRGGSHVGEVILTDLTQAEFDLLKQYGAVEEARMSQNETSTPALTIKNLSSASVDDVNAYMASGAWDKETVLALEKLGEARKSLLGDEVSQETLKAQKTDDKSKQDAQITLAKR